MRLDQFGRQLQIPSEQCILAKGAPTRVILAEANMLNARLIITANHSPTPEIIQGQLSQHLSNDADCDVMMVHVPAGLSVARQTTRYQTAA